MLVHIAFFDSLVQKLAFYEKTCMQPSREVAYSFFDL